MAAKSLVPQILDAYRAQYPQLPATDIKATESFCRYAERWLAQVGFIGMSHSPLGLSLRTKTGEELIIAPDVSVPMAFSAPVQVTGTEKSVMVNTPSRPGDIAVTGGS